MAALQGRSWLSKLAVGAAALAVVGLAPPASAAPAVPPSALTGDQALRVDAAAYAQALSISDTAALDLLKDQMAASKLVQTVVDLVGDRFAGGWISTDPAVAVHLRLTRAEAVPALQRLIDLADLPATVQYNASVSKPTLIAAAQKAAQLFQSGALGIDGVEVDEEVGGLVLIGNRDAVPEAVSKAAAAISSLIPVRIEKYDAAPAADANRGGVAESDCTAGFSVTNGSSTGLMTAGHCGNANNYALTPNGATSYGTTFQREARSSIADLQ